MTRLANDFRHALRTLRANPTFSLLAVTMLALGIGGSTTIFTIVNGVLLRSLPYAEPNRIVQLWEVSDEGNRMGIPEANFADWKAEGASFESMAMYTASENTVLGGIEPVRVPVATVSEGFFDVLGIGPRLGSGFLPEHQRPGAPPVAVVSQRFWRNMLGAPQDLGKIRLRFANRVHTLVGVLDEGVDLPPGTEVWTNAEGTGAAPLPSRSAHNWRAIGRLAPGTARTGASAELNTIASRIHQTFPDVTAVGAVAVPLDEELTGTARTPLFVLMGAVGILLLIACMNVTSLLLAHMESRQSEFALRRALGATPADLARGPLTEALLLAAAGGMLGLVLSRWALDVVLARVGGWLPRVGEIGLDPAVFAFAILIVFAAAVGVGLLPAVRASRSTWVLRRGTGSRSKPSNPSLPRMAGRGAWTRFTGRSRSAPGRCPASSAWAASARRRSPGEEATDVF